MEWSPGVLVLQSAGPSQMLSQSIEAGSIIDHVGRDAISNQEDLFARIKKAQVASRSRGGGSVVELGVKGPDGQDRRVLLRLP